jgi:hypothetical protein
VNQPSSRTTRPASAVILILLVTATTALSGGCQHPMQADIESFMYLDTDYNRLPTGPQRVDAIWNHAREMTCCNTCALRLLGSVAVYDGLKLRHPFNTGLTTYGPLSSNDRTGHFFAHAMWYNDDQSRLIPIADFNSVGWEVIGEVRSWFKSGVGFNWKDIWANRLGWAFGRKVYETRFDPSERLLPSETIREAAKYRPDELSDLATLEQCDTESQNCDNDENRVTESQ